MNKFFKESAKYSMANIIHAKGNVMLNVFIELDLSLTYNYRFVYTSSIVIFY